MNRSTLLLVGMLAALMAAGALWWQARDRALRPERVSPVMPGAERSSTDAARSASGDSRMTTAPATVGDKAARVEKLKRDYDEIRTKAAADYRAAGAAFPGGLNAFLRQLALLEREKRKDLLTVLTPPELEDLELRETHAGELVQRWLGDTSATDEQRRAVFRLQRDFDDQYALSFDLAPQLLVAREADRQALQERIYAVLGDALFPAWLRHEGEQFAAFSAFAANHALAPTVPFALWRLRNELIFGRLAANATPGLSTDQIRAAHADLARRIEAQARALLGPAANAPAAAGVLNWIPRS